MTFRQLRELLAGLSNFDLDCAVSVGHLTDYGGHTVEFCNNSTHGPPRLVYSGGATSGPINATGMPLPTAVAIPANNMPIGQCKIPAGYGENFTTGPGNVIYLNNYEQKNT